MEPKFETVEADTESSFRSIWFSCPSFAEDHTWHYHPEFELTWMVRSQGTRFVGDSIEPYRAGDLVLMGPNLPHCWHDEPGAPGPDNGPEVIVLQFRPESFGGDFLGLPELDAIKRLFRISKCGLHIRGQTALLVQQKMQSILGRKGMMRLIGLLEILQLLAGGQDDVRTLASADYHITNDITEANRRRIELIHRYVRQNLAGNINQSEVARLVSLTPPAFSRFFRKATGQTFVGFVNLLRINEVCRAIVEGSECITNIAMNCGYNNIANFNRQFHALKGMNPTQFKERHQRLAQNAAMLSPDPASVRTPKGAPVSMASSAW